MPKRDVNYTEITCDVCGKKIQLADSGLAYRHLVVITRYAQVWFGKMWSPKGRKAEYYLCENCRDVLMYWLEGDPRQPRKRRLMADEEKGKNNDTGVWNAR